MGIELEWDGLTNLLIDAVSGGTIIYPAGGKFGPRVQNDVQIVLLHTGSMDIYVDDVFHSVPKGHMVLLKPGHREEFIFSPTQQSWHRWIQIHIPDLIEEALVLLESLPFYIPLTDKMNQLTDLILSVKAHSVNPHHAGLLSALGMSAIRLYLAECHSLDASRSMHPAVLAAKSTMHARFGEALTLAETAQAACVTPEHLIRLFRREEQMTPTQYLWRHRMERSLQLLRSTGLSIGEIAERTGFQTSYHFARMIKKHTSQTPTEIRKQSWNQLE